MNPPVTVKPVKWKSCLSALAIVWFAPSAGARELQIPEYRGAPGSTVTVPVALDEAAGVAGVKMRVNFDPNVVTIVGVERGALGSAFDLRYEVDGQVILLSLVRTEALTGGSGTLAAVQLALNPGAAAGMFSDLALADATLCDEFGVTLDLEDVVAVQSGKVIVDPSPRGDSDGDGIPDWWEDEHGLQPDVPDSESLSVSGVPFLQAYAFGIDPAAAAGGLPRSGIGIFDDGGGLTEFLTTTFRRLISAETVAYDVLVSGEIEQWTPDAVEVSAAENFDGTETVTFRDTVPLDAASMRYIRVIIS